MSDTNLLLLARDGNRAAEDASSREIPGEQPGEVVGNNTNAVAALVGAVKLPATEYDTRLQELNKQEELRKEALENIAEQEKAIAELKVVHEKSGEKLKVDRSALESEGKKQRETAIAELGNIAEMVGENNPAFKEVLGAVPPGLTEADVEMVVDDGIKKLAPDIAKNIVDPTKKPEDMSSDEQARAVRYANDIGYTSGDMKEKIEKIKEREKEIDTQTAKQEEAVKGALDTMAAKLPEVDRKAMIDSFNIGRKALNQSGITEEQRANIRNALGAEVGSTVKVSGRTFEVTGHKDGILYLQGEDMETGGIVEQKVPYKNCRIESLSDGTPLADRYEKTLGSGLNPAPTQSLTPTPSNPQKATSPTASERTRPEGIPADYEFHSTSMAPIGTESKYFDIKNRSPGYWGPPAKDRSELPPEPAAPAPVKSTEVPPASTPVDQANAPDPTQDNKSKYAWGAGVINSKDSANVPAPASAPAPAPTPTDEGDAKYGWGANTRGNGKTARDFEPVKANGSAGSDSAEKSSDTSVSLDNLSGTRDGNENTLDKKLSDGSSVVISSYADGTRFITIKKPQDKNGVTVYLASDGSLEKIQRSWDPVPPAERHRLLAELKKIGVNIPN